VTNLHRMLEEGKIRKALTLVTTDEDMWANLITYLEDIDVSIQRAAFEVLAQVGNHPELLDALPMLISGLESGDEVICRYAAEALLHLKADAVEALEELADLLSHDDSELRRAVVRVLAVIGPPVVDILANIIEALSDSDEVVRGEAALAIKNIGSDAEEAVTQLVELLTDEEEFIHNGKVSEVRNAASEALGKIGLAAVPVLLDALREDRPEIRLIAIRTLARIGSLPSEVIRNLEEALQDPDENVRAAARQALKRIKSEG
jgi:HEAT repeat protein